MRLALFSDIHSNLEALEKAEADARGRAAERFVVLGDTVGYGANPNECLDWAVERAEVVLLGNHEKAVVDRATRDWFNPLARQAIEWTAGVLKRPLVEAIPNMPYVRIEGDICFAHGSPDRPEAFRYLLSYADAAVTFQTLAGRLCFVGHTHVPACFCEKARTARHLEPGTIRLEPGERYILNPGSVGQPRDRDPRLAYGILDTEEQTFEIVRLDYENEKAARKIRAAGLPRYLADRLL